MYVARFAINALDSGFTYMSYWVLGNCYYDGVMMDLGLWKYKSTGWKLRPQYYTYSLITRYTDRGSKIYSTDLDEFSTVCMVALQSPNGAWTYLIANSGTSMEKIAIVNSKITSSSLTKYEVTENSIPLDGQTIGIEAGLDVAVVNGVASVAVKANSVVVLTDMVI